MTRADLLQLLAVAAEHAPPCPSLKIPGEYAWPPTLDQWAAHVLMHALALDRAIEATICANEHAAEDVARIADADHLTGRSLGERLLAAWRTSGMPLGKLILRGVDAYSLGAGVSIGGLCDEALVSYVEGYVREHPQEAGRS